VVEAEGRLAFGRQRFPMAAYRLEQVEGAITLLVMLTQSGELVEP
jgi:hypothetical protein